MSAEFIDDIPVGYPELGNATVESPTAELRFLDGVLQQTWEIQDFRGGVLYGVVREWRDVPTESTALGIGE